MQAETSYPAILGRVLEHLRKEKGLDQADVSACLGLTQSAWSRIERGQSGISMEQLVKVGELLLKKPHEILADTDLASEQLEQEGVLIHPNVIAKPNNMMAIIGLVALGGLVAAILMKK